MWKKYKYYLGNLDCANCAAKIERELNKNKNYQNVSLNFSKLTLSLETVYQEDVFIKVGQDVQDIEAGVQVLKSPQREDKDQKDLIFLFGGTGFFLLSCLFQSISWLSIFFCLGSYVMLGFSIFKKALLLLKRGILNENFLIVVSALGAFGISKNFEGFMVLFLFNIGKYLEKRATKNVRRSVSSLVEMQPTVAHKKEGDSYRTVTPSEIGIGDVLVVLKGEKIPLDGKLRSSSCVLDTSSLTGESKPASFSKGDTVLSGTINVSNVLEMEVLSTYENSTVKRILDLMETASDKKAKTENFVNRAARYYTPIMLLFSILVFMVSPGIFQISYTESFYRALMVLVVSCPCAIAISVPLCYFAGLGSMSKHGILVKGSNYIDALASLKQIVFDKTGTLTTGKFGIQEIKVIDDFYSEDDFIRYLVYGESFSNHPLAKSILQKFSYISIPNISNVKEIQGKGISYQYEGKKICLGNAKFVKTDIKLDGTVIFVSIDSKVIGWVILGDEMKENTKSCLEELQNFGIRTIMFTGDREEVAKRTSKSLNLDDYYAELLPEDKFDLFEKLKKSFSEQIIAFVGDGINDTPVLRLSDCGIAMGSGAESAIEASDVIIISNDLEKILEARVIAKKTIKILISNLVFALGFKFLILVFSFWGLGTMWLAVFADVGVTVLTILNSLRILK